jgi:hypothetical protein
VFGDGLVKGAKRFRDGMHLRDVKPCITSMTVRLASFFPGALQQKRSACPAGAWAERFQTLSKHRNCRHRKRRDENDHSPVYSRAVAKNIIKLRLKIHYQLYSNCGLTPPALRFSQVRFDCLYLFQLSKGEFS